MDENQTTLSIADGQPFFAHEASVNFSPTQFTMDFKCVTPRTDPRSKSKLAFQLLHNVVMLDPWHMKQLLQVMTTMIGKYEEEYGNVKKPKSIEIAEKKQKDMAKVPSEDTNIPTYFG